VGPEGEPVVLEPVAVEPLAPVVIPPVEPADRSGVRFPDEQATNPRP